MALTGLPDSYVLAVPITVAQGGTGFTTYTIGDTLFANSTTTLAKLAAGTNGYVLTLAAGVPSWAVNGGSALPGSYVVGDLIYASGAAALAKLADVAVGNSLISGGVGVAPSWGKIALTTHVSGILPSANGGTGVANAGSITNAGNTTITGGGTVALGGFTLTVPATGTAVLTTTAQSIAGIKTFTDTTSPSSSVVGAHVIGNGAAATSVAIGAGSINAGADLVIQGLAAIGTTATNAFAVLSIAASGSPLSGTTQCGLLLNAFTATSAATSAVRGVQMSIGTASAAFTCGEATSFSCGTITKGAASTITRAYSLRVYNPTVGATCNISIANESAIAETGNWFIYDGGTYDSRFGGGVTIAKTSGTTLTVSSADTASSSLVGAVVVGNGTAATSVAIGAGNINAGGAITSSGNIDAGAGTSNGKVIARALNGTSPQFVLGNAAGANHWAIYQSLITAGQNDLKFADAAAGYVDRLVIGLSTGSVLAMAPLGGLGYGTGAGGTVTQATSKATGVTLNKVCGQITMQAAALAAGARVSFVVTNSACAATDGPRTWVVSGGTANAYRADITAVAAGSFTVTVENITAGSLSEAPVIGFDIGKSVIV